MRRSRADLRLGRFLAIGQRYRNRYDATVWTVHQVHRADVRAELIDEHGRRLLLPFSALRADYRLIITATERAAA